MTAEQRRKAKLRRRVRRLRNRPAEVSRRRFLLQGGALAAAGVAAGAVGVRESAERSSASAAPPLRPPGALASDAAFRQACIRCGLCGTVCENGCIRFTALDEPRHGALTPYLATRVRSCTLCMRCNQVCPTDALSPIDEDLETIAREVRVGKAVVDPEHCLSYLGRICGYCHDACPLPGVSIRLAPRAMPVVLDECVGCGRCEELCPQLPTAIHVERLQT